MAGFFRVPVRKEQILLVVGDLGLLLLSLLMAFVIARFAHFDLVFVLGKFTGGSAIYFSTYILVFYIGQLYDVDRPGRESRSFIYISLLVGVAFILIATLYYAVPWWRIARRVMAIQAPLVAVTIYLWRNAYHFVSRRVAPPTRVLLVGGGETSEELIRDIQEGYGQEYRIAGIIDDDPAMAGREVAGVPVLGNSLQLSDVVRREGVQVIVFPSGYQSSMNGHLVSHVLRLKTRGVRVYELPTFYMQVTGKVPVRYIEDRWLLFGQDFPGLAAAERRRIKRLMDLAVAVLCLALLAPVMAAIALLVKLTSRGPALFRQERLGLHREPYSLLKFRTMRVDAEKDGPRWADKHDNRTTPVGKVLRRLRLDEIPQFLNVARGEMSLIGPRPERRHFVEVLEKEIPYYDLRFAVRPGMTGWAQVNFPYGNSVEDAHTKLQYDLYYIQEKSLALDTVIMLKTLQTIMFRPGY